ncbi:GNAT domain-containing protein [Leptodontidium sp. 2 PMI_412]|nr:GNAT domain-containing protein [Leptodontidium sp. 2 PMI_412]
MGYDAETPRLWLERISEKHLQDFHLLWSSQESMIWSQHSPMQTLEQSRIFMQKSLTSVNPKIDKYTILLRPDPDPEIRDEAEIKCTTPRLIGLLGTVGDGMELVYMLHCDFWEKGFMTEALTVFVGKEGIFLGIGDKNRSLVKSLVARIDTENVGSMKTIAKVGARKGELLVKDYGLAKDRGADGEVPVEKLRDTIRCTPNYEPFFGLLQATSPPSLYSMEYSPEKKTILGSLAYHWSEADRAVIHFPTSTHPVPARVFSNCGTSSLGNFSLLPLEIIHNILLELDLASLGAIRCLNTHFYDTVGKVPAYRDLTTFAPNALRALSATDVLSNYSIRYLYNILCRDRCIGCNEFGSFLFLPTASRCCFSCIKAHPETEVVSASAATALFGLTESALSRVTIARTVVGQYGISEKSSRRRIRVVSREEARRLGISIHGSQTEMERAASLGIRRGGNSDGSSHKHRIQGGTNRPMPQPPGANDTLRFMACTAFPYLDAQQRQIDKGVCCRGCEYNWYRRDEDFAPGHDIDEDLFRKQNMAFSEDEFLAHFETCGSAKMLWNDYILKSRSVSESDRSTLFRT